MKLHDNIIFEIKEAERNSKTAIEEAIMKGEERLKEVEAKIRDEFNVKHAKLREELKDDFSKRLLMAESEFSEVMRESSELKNELGKLSESKYEILMNLFLNRTGEG